MWQLASLEESVVPSHTLVGQVRHLSAEPMEQLTFGPAGISVYELGNNGTGAKRLKDWLI